MLTDPDTLRIAVLCSRRAPGLGHLLAGESRGGYLVAGLVCSEEDFAGRPMAEEAGVPFVSRPLRAFHRLLGAPLADREARAFYDMGTAQALREFEPDLVLLLGWTYVLTHPMLFAFPHRILNVHHSDLGAADPARRYPGLHAVRDAILAGEPETRASLHMVDDEVDHGPVVLRSPAFPVRLGEEGPTREAIRWHENLVLDRAFGPLAVAGMTLAATGRLALGPDGAEIDGHPAPFEMDDSGALAPLAVEARAPLFAEAS
ncbi:MAG TPA: formyltransferase family protein [bacterium]|nr:formyltransferase family protein [bacterium]